MDRWNWGKAEKILARGGVGILPTDTLYGLIGLASSKRAVARIYKLKHRKASKPFIVLIHSFNDLKKFGVRLSPKTKKILKKWWPGAVSIILPVSKRGFTYLHRGTKTLAFRMPAKKELHALLKATGPLVAPSANPEGKLPSKTIKEAKNYFGTMVDFYVDEGRRYGPPSTLVALRKGRLVILRGGSRRIKT